MDELISQIRNSQRASQKPAHKGAEGALLDTAAPSEQPPLRPKLSEYIPPLPDPAASICTDSVFDITSSQADQLPSKHFKFDFDVLSSHRSGNYAPVSAILSSLSLRLPADLYAFVKSIEPLSTNVTKWALCDETGVIHASSLHTEENIIPGDILCLSNCSIWQFSENHLNIAPGNIKKIIHPWDHL